MVFEKRWSFVEGIFDYAKQNNSHVKVVTHHRPYISVGGRVLVAGLTVAVFYLQIQCILL